MVGFGSRSGPRLLQKLDGAAHTQAVPGVALTFAQMECLCAVAEAGSLTAAANGMHLAQSSLSRTMADIERAVGTSVLARSARGVSLTVAGEELYAVSREVLASRDVGMAQFRGFVEGRRGGVRHRNPAFAGVPTRAGGAPIPRAQP